MINPMDLTGKHFVVTGASSGLGRQTCITMSQLGAKLSLIARNEEGLIVGVLFGLTDFCYWLYITDLGVDRDYERQGIASKLMKTAHDLAGGEKDIAVYLIANENAVAFYEKLGMEKSTDVMQYNHIEWTEWTVK